MPHGGFVPVLLRFVLVPTVDPCSRRERMERYIQERESGEIGGNKGMDGCEVNWDE
jgi:hypothetical protein